MCLDVMDKTLPFFGQRFFCLAWRRSGRPI
jgi:hypothetical protein